MSTDVSTLRMGDVTTPTRVLPRPPRPAPSRPPRGPGRGLRRFGALTVLLVAGGALGVAAAVVAPMLTGDDGSAPRRIVQAGTVADALRPIGAPTLASAEFSTSVVPTPTEGDEPDDLDPVDDVHYDAVARVDATIDFSVLDPSDVRVIDHGRGVRVHLPAVVLGAPVIDDARSGVVEPSVVSDEGDDLSLLDVIFGDWDVRAQRPVDEDELRATAVADLAGQADASELRENARRSALDIVRRYLASFATRGVDRIDVRFDAV